LIHFLNFRDSSFVKEGSEFQLKIYRLGLELAKKKDNKRLEKEFKERIQHMEDASLRKAEKSKRKMKSVMNMEKQGKEKDETPVKDEELQNIKDVKLQNVVDVTAPEHKDEICPVQVQFYTALAKEISIHSKTLNIRRLNYHKPISLTNVSS
jgi:hypothetical protein